MLVEDVPTGIVLLRLNEVAKIFRVSNRTVYRMMAEGMMPRPIRIGAGNLRWRREDIVNYLVAL